MPFLVNSSWRASRSYLSTDFDRYSSIHSCRVCGFNACKKFLIICIYLYLLLIFFALLCPAKIILFVFKGENLKLEDAFDCVIMLCFILVISIFLLIWVRAFALHPGPTSFVFFIGWNYF